MKVSKCRNQADYGWYNLESNDKKYFARLVAKTTSAGAKHPFKATIFEIDKNNVFTKVACVRKDGKLSTRNRALYDECMKAIDEFEKPNLLATKTLEDI